MLRPPHPLDRSSKFLVKNIVLVASQCTVNSVLCYFNFFRPTCTSSLLLSHNSCSSLEVRSKFCTSMKATDKIILFVYFRMLLSLLFLNRRIIFYLTQGGHFRMISPPEFCMIACNTISLQDFIRVTILDDLYKSASSSLSNEAGRVQSV